MKDFYIPNLDEIDKQVISNNNTPFEDYPKIVDDILYRQLKECIEKLSKKISIE